MYGGGECGWCGMGAKWVISMKRGVGVGRKVIIKRNKKEEVGITKGGGGDN